MKRRARRWAATAAFVSASAVAPSAEAAVQKFALVIGNNEGFASEPALQFAEADALKVRDVLRDLGGFPAGNITLLQGDAADDVRSSLVALNERIKKVVATPDEQAVLVIYYSGHADAKSLHLGKTTFDVAEIEQLARGSAANVRLVVLDACRSGSLTRVKGGVKAPPVAVRTEGDLAAQGLILMTASTAGEDAQESDVLKGSFFTHYLVSGLRGGADRDGDGNITVDEVYEHAREATVRATSTSLVGTQHPTFRFEMRGRAPLVLTSPGAATSKAGQLRFPSGKSYLVLVGSDTGPVVAEVGDTASQRTITLRPGKYFIRARAKDHLLEGPVEVAASSTVDVEDDKLKKATYARLARKGDGPVSVAHGPSVGYTFRSGIVDGASLCHGATVGYGVALEYVELVTSVSFCRSQFENETLESTQDEITATLRASYVFDVPVVSFGIGLLAGGGVLLQSFETLGLAPDRNTATGRLGIVGTVAFDLGAGFHLDLEGSAETYLFLQEDENGEREVTPAFAARPALMLGKWF